MHPKSLDHVLKYMPCVLRNTNRNISISEISNASKAVIEHLIDYHDFCNIAWCRPLKKYERGKKDEGSQSFYRNKICDSLINDNQIFKITM